MRLAKNVVFSETDYGAVLLDEGSGQYWTLNPTGALIMRELLDGRDSDEAVKTVVERYRVDRLAATKDVRGLVDQLLEAGLVRV